jgi:hypothetical protein
VCRSDGCVVWWRVADRLSAASFESVRVRSTDRSMEKEEKINTIEVDLAACFFFIGLFLLSLLDCVFKRSERASAGNGSAEG